MSTTLRLPRLRLPQWLQSVRTRLGVTTGLLVVLFGLLGSVGLGQVFSAYVTASIGGQLAEQAYQMADKLDRGMFERSREIQIVATLPLFHDPAATPAEQRHLLEQLQKTYPLYAWIGLLDPGGTVVASTGGILEGANAAERDPFRFGREGVFIGDVHDALRLGTLVPAIDDEPIRFLDVAVPVRDESGALRGVLAAHLYWSWAREVQQSLLAPADAHAQSEIFVVSRAGTLLLGPQAGPEPSPAPPLAALDAARRGERGFTREVWDGQEYLIGYTSGGGYRTYPGLGWTILVRQPVAQALAPARQLQQQAILGGLLGGAVAALVGWHLSDRVARPLQRIARAADRIRLGARGTPLPALQGEDELATLAASLRSLVAQLQQELAERERAEAALREAVRKRDEFLMIASHELKTPLTALLGFAQLLHRRMGQQERLHEQDGRALQVMLAQGKRVVGQIDAMLDISRIQTGQLALRCAPLDLSALVARVVDELRPMLIRHEVLVELPAQPLLVDADEARLGQVVHNLLSNAVKYSPGGGPVWVAVAQSDGQAQVTVRDQGIGIPALAQGRLFEQFYRAENVNPMQISGFGIGLFIARQIVALHGGTIAVASEEDAGSTFTVRLPCIPSGGSAPPAPQALACPPHPPG